MVQRYRPDELEMIGMHPESDGDYVDYADYIALERELQMIDELMARRPALDDCKTRYDKISKVITTAAQKDALERELDELKADNALLRKRLEPIQELVTYINSCKYLSEHDWQERAYDAIKKCMELKEEK